jgi:uncharacterized membrane-anchored protein YhcB (DUF1043 family)
MWYAICLGIGVILGVAISRVLDKKFDKIQAQLTQLLNR